MIPVDFLETLPQPEKTRAFSRKQILRYDLAKSLGGDSTLSDRGRVWVDEAAELQTAIEVIEERLCGPVVNLEDQATLKYLQSQKMRHLKLIGLTMRMPA